MTACSCTLRGGTGCGGVLLAAHQLRITAAVQSLGGLRQLLRDLAADLVHYQCSLLLLIRTSDIIETVSTGTVFVWICVQVHARGTKESITCIDPSDQASASYGTN